MNSSGAEQLTERMGSSWHRRSEQEKKRAYEVKHGSFSPLIKLVFSTSGGMPDPIATVVYKRITTLHCRETRPALQQNSILDLLKTHLLTAALCHYVHQRTKVLIPSHSWHDWRSHWPHLPGGQNRVLAIGNRHSDLHVHHNHFNLHPLVLFIFLHHYMCTLTSAIILFCSLIYIRESVDSLCRDAPTRKAV